MLEFESQILRKEQHFRELISVYDRFLTLLPIELLSSDHSQLSLTGRFLNLFEQWSTYVDTLSITQQEPEPADLGLTIMRLIELQQEHPVLIQENKSISTDEEENEDELECILELRHFLQRALSWQSLILRTPREKQQLIAQK